MRRDTRPRNLKPGAVAILVLLITIALGVDRLHADVTIDLGRGPVTVHVPPTYDPSQPAPLVMLLHGFTLSGQLQENYFQLLPWSDQLGFLYVFPDGTTDPDGNKFWNATDACCDFYDSGVDDSQYLRDLIDEIIQELNVDTERIFLLGHSNGGFMAYRMACDHADIIAGVATLAGATYVDSTHCTPSKPLRTLQIHGTVDDLVEYEGGLVFGDGGPYPGAVEMSISAGDPPPIMARARRERARRIPVASWPAARRRQTSSARRMARRQVGCASRHRLMVSSQQS